MKLNITRSFSQKKQIQQYEPIDFFASASAEIEVPDDRTDDQKLKDAEKMERISDYLNEFVVNEVEKSLTNYIDEKNNNANS